MSKKSVLEPEYLIPPLFDADGVQSSSGIGVDGKEYPDPVPMAPPVGYDRPEDLMTMIRRMVRSEELRRVADASGFESFEEADDFDIEDDPADPVTPYERVFFPPDEEVLRSAPPVVEEVPVKPAVDKPPVASPAAGSVEDPKAAQSLT